MFFETSDKLMGQLKNDTVFNVTSVLITVALAKVFIENLFSYEPFVHAISGATGSSAAAVLYPLDTVLSRLQLEDGDVQKSTTSMLRQILEREGLRGLYRGFIPVLQSLLCSNFVRVTLWYFYSFHGLRASLNRGESSAGTDLALAAVAGAINVLATTPMWVVNTRMKMRGSKGNAGKLRCDFDSLLEGLVEIARNEGLLALWSSTLPSLILVSNPAIHLAVYEALKRHCTHLGVPPSSGTFFTIGAVSKCVATVLTYPIQLVQSKMRYNGRHQSMASVLVDVVRNSGVAGLFRGLESKLLQTVSTSALMFMAYERIAAIVFAILQTNTE